MLSLFTAPSSTALFANISEWSSTSFDEYLPVAYIVIGSIVGALLVLFIMNVVIHAFQRLVGHFGYYESENRKMYKEYSDKYL